MAKKVNLICVGRVKEKYLRDGIEEYSKRLSRYCDFTITEVEDFADAARVEKEGRLILSKMLNFNILTDLGGEQVTSVELSKIVDKAFLSCDTVSFIIGGSDGVSEAVKSASQIKISFGKVTYPHQLMRLMVCEQIYRSFSIIANTPYHK